MLNIGYSRKSESHSVIAYALRLEMAFLCKYNKVYKLNAFKNPFVIKDIDSITSKYDDKKVTSRAIIYITFCYNTIQRKNG